MLGLKKTFYMLSLLLLLGCLLMGCSQEGKTSPPKQTPNIDKPAIQEPTEQDPVEEVNMPAKALYVILSTTNQVAVVDVETGETVKTIPVGAKPMAMLASPDNQYVYVANSGSGDVYQISTATGEINAKISMGNQPVAMTINAAGDKLYAIDYYLNRVSLIDLKLRSMTGFIELNTFGFEERIIPPDCCSDMFGEPLGKGRKPSAIVLDEERGEIYVGNLGTYDVAVLDIAEEKEVRAYDATFGINDLIKVKDMIFVSAGGNEIEANTSILALNLKGGGKVDKYKVGVKPVNMALSLDKQILYVITQKDSSLTALRLSDGGIAKQCQLGSEPGDIVLSDDGKKAYISNPLDGSVMIVDTQTFSIIDTIAVGVTPKALVYVEK